MAKSSAAKPKARLMRMADVTKETGLCSRTIYRLRNAGKFPEPIDLNSRVLFWRREEFEKWLAGLPSAKPRPAPKGDGARRRRAQARSAAAPVSPR